MKETRCWECYGEGTNEQGDECKTCSGQGVVVVRPAQETDYAELLTDANKGKK